MSLPGQDTAGALTDLLARITELEDSHHQEKLHEQRLIAVMIDRTGAVPLPADMGPVRSYQQLLDRLNTALHGSRPVDEAEQLWSECIAIFRQLFIPPEIRRTELEQLSRIESPTNDERDDVCRRLVSPHDLRYFMNKVTSPAWLGVLGPTRVLDPPDAEAVWPAVSGVVRLGRDHPEAVTAWLKEMYVLHRATPRLAWDLAKAALDIGGPSLNLVLRAVQDHPEHSGILMLGDMATERLDASDALVESFADVLLNESSFSRLVHVESPLRQICVGINEENAYQRVRLLRPQDRHRPSRQLQSAEPQMALARVRHRPGRVLEPGPLRCTVVVPGRCHPEGLGLGTNRRVTGSARRAARGAGSTSQSVGARTGPRR